jgi:DNA-binding IscR family transcriptional regulator
MLETGRFATLAELAAAEKINASYLSRILRLTLRAPEVVEAILGGRQPKGMTLPELMVGVDGEWRWHSK